MIGSVACSPIRAPTTAERVGERARETPPGTDQPKGETSQTSASPKMDKGGMKGTSRKATKKTESDEVKVRAPA